MIIFVISRSLVVVSDLPSKKHDKSNGYFINTLCRKNQAKNLNVKFDTDVAQEKTRDYDLN